MDLVYLWCDDADENWSAQRRKYLPKEKLDIQAVCKGRFVQNDELKYSLRSAAKYMPWINHIFIVSDNQTPIWLNTNHPKITMISHRDIFPEDILPIFNSSAIETALPDIPNLSEYFCYMNDDTLLSAPILQRDLITDNGKIICRMNYNRYGTQPTLYEQNVILMQKLSQEKLGYSCPYFPHHNLDVYCKTAFRKHNQIFAEQLRQTQRHRFRTPHDWQRSLVTYYMLATGVGVLKIINRYQYSFPAWLKHNLIDFGKKDSLVLSLKNKNYSKKLRRSKPKFFCLEDGELVSDEDRRRGKAFLEKMFPDKSDFENEQQ